MVSIIFVSRIMANQATILTAVDPKQQATHNAQTRRQNANRLPKRQHEPSKARSLQVPQTHPLAKETTAAAGPIMGQLEASIQHGKTRPSKPGSLLSAIEHKTAPAACAISWWTFAV
jgi:hypothetical protein